MTNKDGCREAFGIWAQDENNPDNKMISDRDFRVFKAGFKARATIPEVGVDEIEKLVQEDLKKSDEQIWAEAVQRHGSPAAAMKEADRIRDIIKRATDSVCPSLPRRDFRCNSCGNPIPHLAPTQREEWERVSYALRLLIMSAEAAAKALNAAHPFGHTKILDERVETAKEALAICERNTKE